MQINVNVLKQLINIAYESSHSPSISLFNSKDEVDLLEKPYIYFSKYNSCNAENIIGKSYYSFRHRLYVNLNSFTF